MSKLTDSLRTVQVYNENNFAAGEVFISYSSITGRGHTFTGYKVHKKGMDLGTHWTDYEAKCFDLYHFYQGTLKERRAAALKAAQDWASEKFGVKEWIKTPYGSYVEKSFGEKRLAELKEKVAREADRIARLGHGASG